MNTYRITYNLHKYSDLSDPARVRVWRIKADTIDQAIDIAYLRRAGDPHVGMIHANNAAQILPKPKPATVAERIRCGTVKVKSWGSLQSFRGLLRCVAEWGTYTQRVGPNHLTYIGALEAAETARQTCIDANQMPGAWLGAA